MEAENNSVIISSVKVEINNYERKDSYMKWIILILCAFSSVRNNYI